MDATEAEELAAMLFTTDDDDRDYVPALDELESVSDHGAEEDLQESTDDDDDDDSDDDDDVNQPPSISWFLPQFRVMQNAMRRPAYKYELKPVEGDLARELDSATYHTEPQYLRPSQRKARYSPYHMIRQRGLGQGGPSCEGWTAAQCRYVASHPDIVPSHPHPQPVDSMHSRLYIGQFNQDGSRFVAAYQTSQRIRVYDVYNDFRLVKDVYARGLKWTVTDVAISPDRRFLLYSTIDDIVRMVDLSTSGQVYSEANVTDVHEDLFFAASEEAGADARQAALHSREFGIWSLEWSGDGRQVVAGTSDTDQAICLFDVERQQTVLRVRNGHTDDVNAIAFADEHSSDVFFSGSDDMLCKVWDKRELGARRNKPVGVFLGHTEGVAHLTSKKDGRYMLSNGKDQTAKLWDMRSMVADNVAKQQDRDTDIPSFTRKERWDYRWEFWPGQGRRILHPHDGSLQTYRGHQVLETLVRAYFSPAASTAQRYVYTGSSDGNVHVYDLLTGAVVKKLNHHKKCVRDLSWHPYWPLLVTTSFDGSVIRWSTQQAQPEGVKTPEKCAGRRAGRRVDEDEP